MTHQPGHPDPYAETDSWLNQRLAGSQAGVAGGGGGLFTGVSATSDPLLAPVYMGGTNPNPNASVFNGKPIPGAEGGLDVGPSDETTTVGDAYDQFHRMTPQQRAAFAKKLEMLGVLEPGSYGYGELAALWREAVDEAADIYRASGRKVTPLGYLDLMAQTGMGAQGDEFDGKDKFSDTETVNSTTTNLSTKAQARARIRDAFQAELGRDPTRKETRAFFRALRDAEQANPSRTTGTRTSSGTRRTKRNGNTSSDTSSVDNTTTRGGVGQEFDANYIDDHYDTEMDARNTATDYYDALLGLAGGGS
jgi:hypothetical protein